MSPGWGHCVCDPRGQLKGQKLRRKMGLGLGAQRVVNFRPAEGTGGSLGARKGRGPGMTVTDWGLPGSWPGQGA